MLQNIYQMYHDINKKEERNPDMILTSMSSHEEPNKVNKELKYSWDEDEKNTPLLQKMIIRYDLNNIKPRATQVWNCDEIEFDPNGIRNKVICTYKLFQGE